MRSDRRQRSVAVIGSTGLPPVPAAVGRATRRYRAPPRRRLPYILRVTPTTTVLTGPSPRLFVLGERAVLVERGKGLTELGVPAGSHPLAVAGVGRAGNELALVDEAGAIHRYAPGQPPRLCWRARGEPSRLTVTALAGDRLLVATFGRFVRRVELIHAGRRRWRRRGIPDFMPIPEPERLLTTWRRSSLLDGQPAISRLDAESGRERWRVAMERLIAGLAAHPARPEAQRLVIRLRDAPPRRPSWPPTPVAIVGDRAWFSLSGGDLGNYLLALDVESGALASAVALRQVAPSGLERDGEYHLLTNDHYEIFDLRDEGRRVQASSIRGLPTLACRILGLLAGHRALLGSRWGHLIAVDADQPERTRVLFQRDEHSLGDVALAGGLLRFIAANRASERPEWHLVTLPWSD